MRHFHRWGSLEGPHICTVIKTILKMKTLTNDWEMIEALVCDEEFDVSYFSIELANGEKLEISRE